VVVALVSDVGLGVRAWETRGATEMSLGFSVLGSSKEEGVSTYYNILIRIEEEKTRISLRASECNEYIYMK
jgi:hypothetical protein